MAPRGSCEPRLLQQGDDLGHFLVGEAAQNDADGLQGFEIGAILQAIFPEFRDDLVELKADVRRLARTCSCWLCASRNWSASGAGRVVDCARMVAGRKTPIAADAKTDSVRRPMTDLHKVAVPWQFTIPEGMGNVLKKWEIFKRFRIRGSDRGWCAGRSRSCGRSRMGDGVWAG